MSEIEELVAIGEIQKPGPDTVEPISVLPVRKSALMLGPDFAARLLPKLRSVAACTSP
jgi:hypothetical protein